MKIGVGLGALNPAYFEEVVLEAEGLGFESAWLSEHLVFPIDMAGSPFPGGDHPPVPPATPAYDAFGMLCYFAAKTSRIRLGTNIYLLGLRHPFIAARAVQTLDILSNGRVELGVGAGWLREEWSATGLDPGTRGKRLDEALEICKRLWSEERIGHRGRFYDFDPVAFEPKPVQQPHPPLHIGGESEAALRRAALLGDGWLGLHHDLESVSAPLARLRQELRDAGRNEQRFEITVSASLDSPDARDALKRWEDAGVSRIIASPWRRSREACEGLRRLADRVLD